MRCLFDDACRPTGAPFLASGSRLLACLADLMLGLAAVMDSAPGCAGCPLALIDLLHARRGLDVRNPVPTCICTPPPDLLRPLTTLFSSSFSFCIYNKALTHAPFIIIYSVQSPSSRITDIQSHTAAAFCNPLTISLFFVFNMYIDSALVFGTTSIVGGGISPALAGTDFLDA